MFSWYCARLWKKIALPPEFMIRFQSKDALSVVITRFPYTLPGFFQYQTTEWSSSSGPRLKSHSRVTESNWATATVSGEDVDGDQYEELN